MASKWYTDVNRNSLQKVKRINKSTVQVTIKNDTGYYYCNVEYSDDVKYGRWQLLELAVNYFKERGFGF